MRKTPLNKHMREQLKALVGELVDFPEEGERCAQLHGEIGRLIRNRWAAMYPAEDMKVLEKYGLARVQTSAAFRQSYNRDVPHDRQTVGIEIPPILIPQDATTRFSEGSEELPHKIEARIMKWIKMVDAYLAHLEAQRMPYNILIEETRYYEDVCDVWPEARRLAERFGQRPLLPARVTPELIAQIRADMERRDAA